MLAFAPTFCHNLQRCRSEVDDINLGLQHFYGDFNVVHGRLISSGVSSSLYLLETVRRGDYRTNLPCLRLKTIHH